ncbi:helix-turn-helix transcriptional regulator [Paracoccus pacificus]|uniref:Helix-turn-helix transcriptional regulator n=1 Tax=Paracoccus pacificus TaxID=1463598 RepID=A0ABW4RDI4_9RHOB
MAPKYLSSEPLASELLNGLAQFRSVGSAGNLPHGENLFSYCALAEERLIAVDLPHPIIGVVICGAKEIWRGTNACLLPAGSLFVLPARTAMDILNLPDPANGHYQSIILEVREVPEILSVAHPAVVDGRRGAGDAAMRVGLTRQLVDAVAHAASAIADDAARAGVRRARMTELLALLRGDPAARPLFDLSVAGRVKALIGGDLAHGWKAPDVARAIGVSESTLRRRLAEEGITFSALLRRERLSAAKQMIDRRAPVQSAAIAVGYASRTHFARRFRAAFGANPSEGRPYDLP